MSNLELVKSETFGNIQCDFYSKDDEVYMTNEQLTQCLGYSDRRSIAKIIERNPYLKEKEFSVVDKLSTTDGKCYDTRIFTEDGIYEITMLSKTNKAREFKAWVRTVIKSIRKHGAYMTPKVIEEAILNPDTIIGLATALKSEQERNRELRAENQALAPKAEYFDELVDRHLLTTFRETAKQFKVGEQKLIHFLMDRKYIYRDRRGKLLPYARKNSGLFEVKEYILNNDYAGLQTFVTPRGREKFRALLKTMHIL